MDLDYPARKTSPPRFTIPPPPLPVVPLEEMASAPKRKLQECPSGETGAKRKETKPEVKKEEPKKKEEQMEVDETSSSTATLTDPSVKPKEKRKSIKVKKEPAKTTEAESAPVPASMAQENATAPAQMSDADKTKSLKKKKKVAEMNGETPKEPTQVKPVPAEESLLPATIEAVNSTPKTPESPKAPKQLAAEAEPLIPTPVLEKSVPVEPPKAPAAAAAAVAQAPKETAPVEAVKAEAVKEGSPAKSTEGAVKRRPQTLKYRTKTEDLSSKTKSVSPEKSMERREIPRNDVRRKSSIFEKAEMFNNMSANNLNRTSPEKGRKLNIGGVNISDFKTAFEKKAPAKSASTAVASEEPKVEALKKPAVKAESPKVEKKTQPAAPAVPAPAVAAPQPKVATAVEPPPSAAPAVEKAPEPVRPVEATKPIIKPAAIEAPEIKPRVVAAPRETTPKLPARQTSPPKTMPIPIKAKTPDPEAQKKKSTTMKIILDSSPKSATLPRRTSKAEIKLNNQPAAPLIPPTPQQKAAEYR